MKFEKLNFVIVIFSIIAIVSFSFTISTDEAFSLRVLDSDHDGVSDDIDECPQIAETYNKFEDDDGCPDTVIEEKIKYEFPDTDGDGIEDRIDNCVTLPETFNDYLDYDGCPETVPNISEITIDSDSDTIPDSIDACPSEKETFNEFKDGDGCPDSITPTISESSGNSFSFENQCLDGKIPVIRINSQGLVCVVLDTAKRWEKLGIAEIDISSILEDVVESEGKPKKLVPKPKAEIILPEISDESELSPDLIKIEQVSSETILDTGKTVIGQDITYPPGIPHITSKIVTIPVGAETGPHTHEFPLFGYVMEGEIIVDYGDQGIKTFVKGDSFVEAINYTHNGKNNGDEPAEILVVLIGEN